MIFMIMAEQSTSQQEDQQMVNIILANVGTVVCFRTGNPQDELTLLPMFSPYIHQGEISNLPAFCFYMKLSAIQPQEPLSGQTLLLDDDGDDAIFQKSINYSRSMFAKKQELTEEKQKQTIARPNNNQNKEEPAVTVTGEPMIDND